MEVAGQKVFLILFFLDAYPSHTVRRFLGEKEIVVQVSRLLRQYAGQVVANWAKLEPLMHRYFTRLQIDDYSNTSHVLLQIKQRNQKKEST